jgi:hypothetical protein
MAFTRLPTWYSATPTTLSSPMQVSLHPLVILWPNMVTVRGTMDMRTRTLLPRTLHCSLGRQTMDSLTRTQQHVTGKKFWKLAVLVTKPIRLVHFWAEFGLSTPISVSYLAMTACRMQPAAKPKLLLQTMMAYPRWISLLLAPYQTRRPQESSLDLSCGGACNLSSCAGQVSLQHPTLL